MKYDIVRSDYHNTQVVEGSMELIIEGLTDSVYIDVTEVLQSHISHEVSMKLNFTDQAEEHIQNVLKLIPAEQYDSENKDYYMITNDNLVKELFNNYGNNAR